MFGKRGMRWDGNIVLYSRSVGSTIYGEGSIPDSTDSTTGRELSNFANDLAFRNWPAQETWPAGIIAKAVIARAQKEASNAIDLWLVSDHTRTY